MNDHLGHKIINLGVAKLSNSLAKAGPMSEANALGLTCVPRLDLNYFASQYGLLRLDQKVPDEGALNSDSN
jgi:hypothetical protein